MADYIYLLQNRLTPAQWRALEAVREAARAQSMPVFLVGGAVRDLTTGSPVRDLDFAVQGDARALVADMEARGATVAGESAAFGSVYLLFRGGVRVEVSPTQSVTYPKPGKPETQPAPILDDLRRRDFTANAMAVSLNEGSYGLLLDPLNGTADIENRELRLVSAYGFIEQPALLLRAARLGERLGWSLEERTRTRYDNSKEEGHIEALPEADRNYELEEIFHEEDPLAIMEHLAAEGWQTGLLPALQASDGDRHALDEVRDLASQLEGQGLHPDLSAVFFPLVTAKMSEANRAALKQRFARAGFVQQIETLEARSKELASQLTSKAAALPSETWRVITGADPEVVLYLAYHSRSGSVQSKIKAFLKEWPQLRQKIPYALMQEMRITPDLPGYDKLLDDLFFALMDGKLDTTEATRAFLEPYSPPAPPQVTVRRRPAKATRSRSKKAAEEAVSEPDEDEEDITDAPSRSKDRDEDLDDEDHGEKDDDEKDDDRDDKEEDAEEEEDDDDQDVAPRKGPSRSKPAKPSPPPAPVAKAVAPAAEAEPAPVAVKTPAKNAQASRPAPAIAGKPSRDAAQPKDVPAPRAAAPDKAPSSPAKKTIANKVVPAKAVPAKKVPAKVVVVKAAGKAVVPAKAPAPAKAVVKVAPKKVATKSAPVKAAPVVATKKGPPAKAPAKAAKKVAAKGRGAR